MTKSDEHFIEGRWFFEITAMEWCYIAPGWYDAGIRPDIAKRLSNLESEQLVRAMDEQGHIKPRLDERLRTEDLKITHRLLDLLEGAVTHTAGKRGA